ncbi:hypothetical protein AX16_008178 [Volvariella volvacea WC 439]|nr:hypothetical protein AX16_008178 [Volvariella volvacea WC 439]
MLIWPVRNGRRLPLGCVFSASPYLTLRAILPTPSRHYASLPPSSASSASSPKSKSPVDASDGDVVPPLDRPLGVRERPTTIVKSRTERIKELMDTEARMEQRRHLIKEASKGYFHDMHQTRKHGGKTWIAPKVLIREDRSLYLPNITGKSLNEGITKSTTTMCFGRVSVIAMLGTKVSEVGIRLHRRYVALTLHFRSRLKHSQTPHTHATKTTHCTNLFKLICRRICSSHSWSTCLPSHCEPPFLQNCNRITLSQVRTWSMCGSL